MNSAHKLTSKKLVTLGIIVFFMLLIAYMLYTNRLEVGVFLSSHNDYAPTWSLDYVTADEENRTLEVSFDSNILKGSRILSIKNTYNSIKEHFLLDPESKFKDFTITIKFRNISELFEISEINTDHDSVVIRVLQDTRNISIKDIAAYFTNTSSLVLRGVYYINIDEFDGFYDLDYLKLDQQVSHEEWEYIQKRFPGCKVEIWMLVQEDPK